MENSMSHPLNLLVIINFCIAAVFCSAMENQSLTTQSKILMELTNIVSPFNTLYLTENSVLINSAHHCSIVNSNTGQEIKRIFKNNGFKSQIAVHPNRTKFAFSYYCKPYDGQKIIIYNAQTYEPEKILDWNGGTINSLHFSPLNKTIALGGCNLNGPVMFNYETNDSTIIDIKRAQPEKEDDTGGKHYPTISFHPTQPLMCLAWKNIYTLNLTTSESTKLLWEKYHNFCEYSPDGSCIARGKLDTIIISDAIIISDLLSRKFNRSKTLTTITDQQSYFSTIAIHPNNKILVTVLEPKGILQYWDIKKSKLITATTSLPLPDNYWGDASLSFSPNGKKLLMIIFEKCAVLEVPFEALYEDVTKDHCIFALWALQHYRYDDEPLLQDIQHGLIKYLLAAAEY
jgi:WD40 repeat protein